MANDPQSPDHAEAGEATPSETKRVFIVGCRRSGTTWTMLLLGQHPRVVALQQLDYFRRLHHFASWYDTDQAFGACILTQPDAPAARDAEMAAKGGLARLPLSTVASRDAFLRQARPLARDLYERFAACGADTLATVEQTPEYVQVWETVLAVFPDAYFVHVVRDPRSVFASHKNAARSWADPTRFSHDPIDVAREWRREVTRGRAIGEETDNYVELRYEDLRADPVSRLERLFGRLDLPADRALCERAVEAASIKRARASGDLAPAGFFRKGEVAGWRDELSTAEIRTIEYLTGDMMTELGYEMQNDVPVPMPARLRWRRFRERTSTAVRKWAWTDDGFVRRTASKTLKAFPGLRKVLLRRIEKPG